MRRLMVGSSALFAIQLGFVAAGSHSASALSVDLAKKCREMAIKAHPYTIPGEKGAASAAAERAYYSDCLSKDGNMPSPTPSTNPPDSPPTAAPVAR